MKRKRLDRDIWNFGNSRYYQMRVDMDAFHGVVGLLQLESGNIHLDNGEYQYWERPKAGKVAICGKGMTWLQLIPDGKKRVITVKYLPNNKVSLWYVDIIEGIEFDKDGVAVFIDKYLDVTFTPQGDARIDDRDELDEAFESGELSREQYDEALKEGEDIMKELCSDIAKTEDLCDKLLIYVNGKIAKGEKQFVKG